MLGRSQRTSGRRLAAGAGRKQLASKGPISYRELVIRRQAVRHMRYLLGHPEKFQISLNSQHDKHCEDGLDPNLQGRDGQFFEVPSRSRPDLDNIEIWVFSRPATVPLHPHPLLPIYFSPFHFISRH